MRTTFYDKKHSLWRGEPMQLIQLTKDAAAKEAEVAEKGFAEDKGVKEGEEVDKKVDGAAGKEKTTGLDTTVKSAAKSASKNYKDKGEAGTDGSKDAKVTADEDAGS
jgi:hypothetical protein